MTGVTREKSTKPRIRVGARTALALMSGAAVAGPFVAGMQPTGAFAKCEPPRADDNIHYWDGWYRLGAAGGVYAKILNYSPWVEPNSGDEDHISTAWTMLARDGQEDQLWAQVGWLERPSGWRRTFVQIQQGGGPPATNFYGVEPTGANTYYTTMLQGIYFVFQVNGTTVQTTRGYFTPNEAQISGEITTYANQMPGASNAKEVFDDSHIWLSGAWVQFDGSQLLTDSQFGYNRQSALREDIWDTACTS